MSESDAGGGGDACSGDACSNCSAPRVGAYCPACGQDQRLGRLRTGDLFRAVLRAVTDADSRMWVTLRGLTLRPGRFAQEYIDGHRADRVHPFKYLLVVFSATLLLSPWTTPPLDPSVADSPEAAQATGLLIGWFHAYAIPAVFLGAGLLRLTDRRGRHNYAEHATFTLYTIGHGTLLAVVLLPVLFFDYWTFSIGAVALIVAYAVLAGVRFYDGAVGLRALRMLGVLVVYYGFATFVGMLIVIGVMLANRLG